MKREAEEKEARKKEEEEVKKKKLEEKRRQMEEIKRKKDDEEEAKKKKEQEEEEAKRKERAEALKKKREDMKKIVEADPKRVDKESVNSHDVTLTIDAKSPVSPTHAPTPTPSPVVATDPKITQRGSKELKSDVSHTPSNSPCPAADVMCPWRGSEKEVQTHLASCHYVALRPVLSSLLKQNQEILTSLKELKQLYFQLKKQ